MTGEDSWCRLLQAAGHKATRPRRLILKILADSQVPLTAHHIFMRITEADGTGGLATVYRNLKLLEQNGLVQKTGLLAGQALYSLADGDHQHHLICLGCRKTVPLADCPLETYSRQVGEKEGFTVTTHKMELYGWCRDCRGLAEGHGQEEKKLRRQAGRKKEI